MVMCVCGNVPPLTRKVYKYRQLQHTTWSIWHNDVFLGSPAEEFALCIK